MRIKDKTGHMKAIGYHGSMVVFDSTHHATVEKKDGDVLRKAYPNIVEVVDKGTTRKPTTEE